MKTIPFYGSRELHMIILEFVFLKNRDLGCLCYLPFRELQILISSDWYVLTNWKGTSLSAISFRETKPKGNGEKMLFVYQQCIVLLRGPGHREVLIHLLSIPGDKQSGKADC